MALFGLALRFFSALALWPLAVALAVSFGRLVVHLPWTSGQLPWFAGGFAVYLAVHALLRKPLFLYVMGHELTHALAAVLQGGSADDLHVSTKGGKVMVNRSNLLVNLAPYFFPLYTVAACAVWAVAAAAFRPALSALVGFTLAFHLALTAHSLRQHQSDIAEVGWFLALPLILSLNVLIAALVLRLLCPGPTDLGALLSGTFSDLASFAHWLRATL